MLIPEIALTYQTLMRFYHRFGDRVSIIHSKMSAGERSDQFERARRGEIDVMIGPRSALFTPFEHLGIIVIDEEHEESYRSGQAPRYHAATWRSGGEKWRSEGCPGLRDAFARGFLCGGAGPSEGIPADTAGRRICASTGRDCGSEEGEGSQRPYHDRAETSRCHSGDTEAA